MKPPAFQFYADDFIGGTVDLSAEEVGAYIRLLCYQWGRGTIPDDRVAIARVSGCEVSDAVLAKFPNGKNPRLEEERSKQLEYREKQATAGIKGAKTRWGRHSKPIVSPLGSPMGSPMGSPSKRQWQNDSSPSPNSTPLTPQGGDSDFLVKEEEWLARLTNNPTYADLDIPAEFAKAQREHHDKGRQLTRSRFISHLSKIEKPPPPKKPYAPKDVYTTGPPITEEVRLERLAAVRAAKAALAAQKP